MQQPREQKHQEVLHCGALYKRSRGNLQKHLQEIWSGGVLKRRKHNQRSSSSSQGQGHHTEEKWSNIHVQMWKGRLWRRIHW